MGISDIYQIGIKALTANRFAVEVTSHNIANANTPGYVRQEAILATGIPQEIAGKLLGRGVEVQEIRTIQNSFLDFQIFAAAQRMGQYQSEFIGAGQLDEIMGEAGDTLASSLSEFFNSLQELSSYPEDTSKRVAVKGAAESMVQMFHHLSSQLSDMRSDLDMQIQESVDEVNELLSEIASLNQQILKQNAQGTHAGDYAAKRYQLLDELSQYIDFQQFESDDGTINLSSAGITILEGTSAASLRTEADPANDGLSKIVLTTAGGEEVNITGRIRSGSIKGALVARDEYIKNSLDALDELAYQITSDFNAIHSAGYGLDGNSGYMFFQPLTGIEDAASQIALSSDIDDPTHIAAAQEPVPGDNRNALALAGLRDALTMNGNTATYQDFLSSLIAQVGSTARETEQNYEVQELMHEQAITQREMISGVSLEEEMAKLIQFQQSLEAAARIMEIGSEILETVISLGK